MKLPLLFSEQEQLIVLWGNERENFDEKEVITKSGQAVVIGIFVRLTSSKFAGQLTYSIGKQSIY
jgi:hypothetical protein